MGRQGGDILMGWKDFISYPGELEDQNMEQAVKAMSEMVKNLNTLSEAVIDLQRRVRRLEESVLKTLEVMR